MHRRDWERLRVPTTLVFLRALRDEARELAMETTEPRLLGVYEGQIMAAEAAIRHLS